jgi:pyruvate formate lyase activating enzyme
MELPFFGVLSAAARDPIEKKPLYHWRPGSTILSVGFYGCNLRCPFCQNWRISQAVPRFEDAERLSPEELISRAESAGEKAIAYTYSEPLVHVEYLLGCMREARKRGVANVLVSNGCVNGEAAEAVLDLIDAANIDLKCFSADTYRNVLGGDLDTVKEFISLAVKKGVHLEVTTLVVPGLNDGKEELDACADFIAGVSPEIPYHLSAYHPDWKYVSQAHAHPPTAPARLREAGKRAADKLKYVHLGNIRV